MSRSRRCRRRSMRRRRTCPTDLPTPPIYSKVNPADAPILTLAMTSDSMPLPQVEDLADTTFAQKISQLPGVGLVSHQRRAEASRAHHGESDCAGFLWHEPGAVAHGHRAGQRRPGEGTASGQPAVVHHRRQRSVAERAGLRATSSSPTRTAIRCGCRTSPKWCKGAENAEPGGVDEHHAGGDSEHPAPAGRKHHQGCRQHQEAAARSCRRTCLAR